ncbi:MAG: hypothetical protein IH987_21735, partial [Planctomycetes bacterium]|nr:hypothetical protein [Planctomycetota bacterium]
IGICQLAALLYGLYVLWLARPVFLVFVVDRFNLVFANQVPQSELDLAKVDRDFDKPPVLPSPLARK